MTATTRTVSSALLGLVLLATPLLAHEGDPKLIDRQPGYTGRGYRNATHFAPGADLELGLPALSFPSNGVTLLSWLTLADMGVPASGNGNSCFGYVSGSGREYAIMGLSTGTAFVEVTQPGNAQLVAHVAGPESLWRDMKVFQTYCYAISEGGSGIQVMNMAQIDAGIVTLVNTINDDQIGATHTLAVNPASGYLYRTGGGANGLRIYNLNANPANPQRVGTWSDRYVHEAQVVTYTSGPAAGKEIAICCGGFNGGFDQTGIDIVDVTNKSNIQLLQRIFYPDARYSHQAWLSPDRQWLYLNDELDDSQLGITSRTRIFNASNPSAMTYVGFFTNGNSSVDHNLYTKGNLIYEANYRSGLRIYDASNPTNPVQTAFFDTYPDDDEAKFNGLWNNYPYLPSGTVIGSDIEKGLFVWWVGTPQLTFELPAGEPVAISPGGAVATVEIDEISGGTLVAGTEKLHYDIGAGWVVTDLVALGGNAYSAVFPPSPCGTTVKYFFTAQSTNGVTWSSPQGAPSAFYSASSAVSSTVTFTDAFQTNQGWTAGAAGDSATTGLWTRVDPIGTDAQPEDDHTPGPGNTLCFVTGQGLVGGDVGDADVDGGKTTLLSPVFNMSTLSMPHISYWRLYSNDQGGTPNADVFRVDITNNNGSSWTNVETVGPTGVQTAGGWYYHELRVSDFVTPTAQVRVRFVAEDAGSGSIVEAAVDDFKVTNLVCTGSSAYCFGDGTATACPCGNFGEPGHGCANSSGASGLLASSGVASIANDTLVLQGSGMTINATALYFQGTQMVNGGLGTVLGDGLRCVGGSSIRLGTKTNVGDASSYPEAGDLDISIKGAVSSGATRYYQTWYRNPASFCTVDTFNTTNAMTVIWAP